MKRICPALLCCLLLWLPVFAAQGEEAGPDRTIVIATDLHYLSPTLTDYGQRFMRIIEGADGKVTHYTPQICEAFVVDMLRLRPDAVILSGDLTLNGAPVSHEELADLLQPLREAGVRVLVIPGNHDTETPAYRFTAQGPVPIDGTPNNRFTEIYADYGYTDALDRDAHSLSYVAELYPDVWALMLDVNGNGANGTVKSASFPWIERVLEQAQAQGITVLGVSHQTLLPHNALFVSGFAINNYSQVLEMYQRYGVQCNFSGHMHIQHIAQASGVTEIVTESMAVPPCPYGILRLKGGAPISYDTRAVDVAGWARENGVTNQKLLNFPAYAEDFYFRTAKAKIAASLTDPAIQAPIRERMATLGAKLNAQYFSGARSAFEEEADFALWQQYGPRNFFTYYLKTILDEPIRDMNHFSFQTE
ncbi:MAG: metallophosphoesterase [Clostridia bacterium]|nr:metallophosphoesterase [Clostridia bacterium]